MTEHWIFRKIVAGESALWAMPVRAGLRLLETAYGTAVSLRNARYDQRGPERTISVPVISVGNLTVGGTGKTPFVIHLVNRLDALGFSPAVASRGYGAVGGASNDEERLLKRRCPSVACVADPDRAAAAERAVRRFGADVVVLDDGFQHRRLGRNLDIVLIDATCPFGYGHLLPRGLLREPVRSIRRAQVLALTRCDQASGAALARIETTLRGRNPDAVMLKCRHRVIGIDRLDGTPVDGPLEKKRAVLFAGIARPQAFVTTVRSLGMEVVGHRWWPDHHSYSIRDLSQLTELGRFQAHDLLLTTEKDAVKLVDLDNVREAPIGIVKIAIDFMGDGDTILDGVLKDTLARG